MKTKKDHNKLEPRRWRTERILDIFFSDPHLSESRMERVRRWLVEIDLEEIKDEALSDKFQAMYTPGKKSKYAKELWPGIASRLGFDQDIDSLLDKHATLLSNANADPFLYNAELGSKVNNRKKTTPLFVRWSLRIAAVLLPAIFVIGTYSYYNSQHTNLPQNVTAEFIPEVDQNPQPIDPDPIIVEVPKKEEEVAIAPTENIKPAKVKEPLVENIKEQIVYDLHFNAPENESRYVKLPDNTTVVVNCGGTLRYSTKNRHSVLIGEAYFNVAKGNEIPFRMKTGHYELTVTGTEFNARAYENDKEGAVSLIKGSVHVHIADNTIPLSASQHITVNKTGNFDISTIPPGGWWEEPLVFESKPLSEIVYFVGNYYSVEIRGREQLNDTLRYTIKLDRQGSIDNVLKIISQIAPGFEYERDGTAINVNMNAFSNQ